VQFEIERKFLVRSEAWENLVVDRLTIRQAYLDDNPKVSIRVRIKNNATATLSLKSRPSLLRRLELEYPIPVLEAEALMPLRQGHTIEKVRHIVPCGELFWEVDRFEGDNSGLIVAEIELPHEQYEVKLPPWIGAEVTGQTQYYNGTLAQRPFSSWPQQDHEASADRG
jgi:adenylate cyclase